MNFKEIIQSKAFRKILYGIGALIIAMLIFHAGVFVGYHKAAFSYRYGDNYYKTFGEPRGHMPRGFGRDNFSDTHGAIGKIIKINLPTLIISDKNNIEKIILIKDDTQINRFRETLKPTDLKIDDFVVVIGTPNNQSQVEAKLIRLMPTPPESIQNKSDTQ